MTQTARPFSSTATAEASEAPRRRRRPIDRGHVLSYLILIGFGLVYLGPMLMLVITAFKTTREFNRSAVSLPTTFDLHNFFEAWDKANFPRYLLNTAIYTVVSVITIVITGLLL
jgi:raffinose/stachyose/melibiose transport system permease protein